MEITPKSHTMTPLLPLKPGLYIVSTPIGNPLDITLRALHTLKNVAIIACEDTRFTKKLLKFHGITATSLTSYHDYNGPSKRPLILARLKEGSSVALVSDRGTPLISDPGYKLVQACIIESIPLHIVPGPSALTAAICLLGLTPDRFLFQGFLPSSQNGRIKVLKTLVQIPLTLIFFEAPHRLINSLKDMELILGNRPATLVRELTKTYEEVKRGTLKELIYLYEQEPARGEIIIGVSGMDPNPSLSEDLLSECRHLLEKNISTREIFLTLKARGFSPRETIYKTILKLKDENNET